MGTHWKFEAKSCQCHQSLLLKFEVATSFQLIISIVYRRRLSWSSSFQHKERPVFFCFKITLLVFIVLFFIFYYRMSIFDPWYSNILAKDKSRLGKTVKKLLRLQVWISRASSGRSSWYIFVKFIRNTCHYSNCYIL